MKIRLRQKRQRKEKKASSDDDESHWVQIAIAAAGLGLSLYDRYKQGKIDEEMAGSLGSQNVQNFRGMEASAQTYEASRDFTARRMGEDISQMSEAGASALNKNLGVVRDAGGSFASNAQTDTGRQNAISSAWDVYEQGYKTLERKKEDDLLTLMTQTGTAGAQFKRNVGETKAQVEGLRA
tara:strand:+ start:64 stop:606 length:543 start_codon:yes stop_codon:yes gene_type:complete